jgi:hypothetical protein
MVAMAHIQAEGVGPGLEQCADFFGGAARWTKGRQNADFALAGGCGAYHNQVILIILSFANAWPNRPRLASFRAFVGAVFARLLTRLG